MSWKDHVLNVYGAVSDAFNEQYDYPDIPEPQTQKQVTGPIDTYVNITLDGSGNGIASVGPQRVREWWSNLVVAVSVATTNNEAQCSVFTGSTMQSSTFMGTTPNGSHGATATLPNSIPAGYLIWAKWTGGDAGAQATLHITGNYSIGQPR